MEKLEKSTRFICQKLITTVRRRINCKVGSPLGNPWCTEAGDATIETTKDGLVGSSQAGLANPASIIGNAGLMDETQPTFYPGSVIKPV